MYEYGGHFRSLLELYEKGELTNVINRVVENINHSFTRKVVEQTFKSHDIALTASNLLRDNILNKEEQSVQMEDYHMKRIEEYLTLLDLVMKIDLEFLPNMDQKNTVTVITQPGMRYAQSKAIVSNLLLDAKFSKFSLLERQQILERLLSEIQGRMMENIILLETKIANPKKKVCKLQFAVGEFDMVVFDPKAHNCKIYEVKYSKEQARYLKDEKKCTMTSHRYGETTGKYVIYRGDSSTLDGIQCVNGEEYLKVL